MELPSRGRYFPLLPPVLHLGSAPSFCVIPHPDPWSLLPTLTLLTQLSHLLISVFPPILSLPSPSPLLLFVHSLAGCDKLLPHYPNWQFNLALPFASLLWRRKKNPEGFSSKVSIDLLKMVAKFSTKLVVCVDGKTNKINTANLLKYRKW